MKKILSLALLLCLLAGLFGGTAAIAAEETAPFIVGNTTQMSGNFFLEAWGNNSADLDVRELLHSYPTMIWDYRGTLSANPQVVLALSARTTADGSKSYEIHLRKDLKFSDGSPVTAKDFVFSVLLEASPVIAQIGGTPAAKDHIVGANAYTQGTAKTIKGLRLIDETTFSISIAPEFLPNFYELAYALVKPYPIAVIAPGTEVKDDGEGAYIDGPFDAELLSKTILDPTDGYMSHPKVVTGPYILDSYDAGIKTATFSLNPHFTGNRTGQKPTIEKIVYKEVKNATVVEELRAGTVNLVNKITAGSVIEQLEGLRAEGVANFETYPRIGLGFISFATEQGLVQSQVIRGVVAGAIDKDTLVAEFLKGNGEPAYGLYGLGQWMAQRNKEQLKTDLNLYPHDVLAANAKLDTEGWTLNENGEAYVAGEGKIRHKMVDGVLTPLTLKLAVPLDNEAAEYTFELMQKGFAEVGMGITIDRMEMREVVSRYFRQMERGYDMFFLGTNFSAVFDPYMMFHTADIYQGSFNTTGIRDEKLLELAMKMREVPSGEQAAYYQAWLDFQKYFAEVQPMVPLYTNNYFDAFDPHLTGYKPGNHTDWPSALIVSQWAP